MAATFSLRLKGKPVLTTEPLKVKVDLKSTLRVSSGAKLEMAVEAAGGVPPYSYAWKKVVLLFPDRRRQRSVRHQQHPVMPVRIPARFLIQQALLTR